MSAAAVRIGELQPGVKLDAYGLLAAVVANLDLPLSARMVAAMALIPYERHRLAPQAAKDDATLGTLAERLTAARLRLSLPASERLTISSRAKDADVTPLQPSPAAVAAEVAADVAAPPFAAAGRSERPPRSKAAERSAADAAAATLQRMRAEVSRRRMRERARAGDGEAVHALAGEVRCAPFQTIPGAPAAASFEELI